MELAAIDVTSLVRQFQRACAPSLLLLATAAGPASAFLESANPGVTIVGEFSNMRYTEEHAYGFTVELWREGEQLFGLFLASAGLAGDTPAGLLENVKYDPRTGRLSFSAKLTMGSVMLADGEQAPSRDFFEFDGTLGPSALAGTLRQFDRLEAGRPSTSVKARLRKQRGSAMTRPNNYGEWRREVEGILRFRGPKW
jgi:hypothetical protein